MGDVLCSFETQIYRGNSAGPVASKYRRESEGILSLSSLPSIGPCHRKKEREKEGLRDELELS